MIFIFLHFQCCPTRWQQNWIMVSGGDTSPVFSEFKSVYINLHYLYINYIIINYLLQLCILGYFTGHFSHFNSKNIPICT